MAGARGSGRENRGLLESIGLEEATDDVICATIAADVSEAAGILPSDISCSPEGNGFFRVVVTFRAEWSSREDIAAFANALTNNPDGVFGSFPPGTVEASEITVTIFGEDPGGYDESMFYGMLYGIEFAGQPPIPLPPVPTATPAPLPTATPAPSLTPAPTGSPTPTSSPGSCDVGGDVADVAHADLDVFVPISDLNPLSIIVAEAPCDTRRKLLGASGDSNVPDSVPPCSVVTYTEYAFTCAASFPKEETCLVAFVVFPEDVDQDSLDTAMEAMGNDPATIFTSFDDQVWEIDAFFGPFQSQMRLSSALPAECCPGNADQPSFCSSGTSDGSSSSDAPNVADASTRAGDDLFRLLEDSSENDGDEDSSQRRGPNKGSDDDDGASEERDLGRDSGNDREDSSQRSDPEKGRGHDDDGDDDGDDEDAGKQTNLDKGSDDHEDSSERSDPEKGRGGGDEDDDDQDEDAGKPNDPDKGSDGHPDSSELRDREKGRGDDDVDDGAGELEDGDHGIEDVIGGKELEDDIEAILQDGSAAGSAAIINTPAESQTLDQGVPEPGAEPTLADFVPFRAEKQEGSGPGTALGGLQERHRVGGEEVLADLASGGAEVDVSATNISSPVYPNDANISNATAGFLIGSLPGEETALDPALYTVLSGRDPVELTKDGEEPLVKSEIPAFMRTNDGAVDLETHSKGGVDFGTRSIVEFADTPEASGPNVDGGRRISTAVGAIVACVAFSILAAGFIFIHRHRLSEGLERLRRHHRLQAAAGSRPGSAHARQESSSVAGPPGAAWELHAYLPGNARDAAPAPPWEDRAPDRI